MTPLHIPFEQLRDTLQRIFERHGASPNVAHILANKRASPANNATANAHSP